ncbi:hypothetical protein G6F57_021445 [Rhizopus arrhizus]|nr:hypothetical protein G6F57_021445 [Rhizopus arrhizus]
MRVGVAGAVAGPVLPAAHRRIRGPHRGAPAGRRPVPGHGHGAGHQPQAIRAVRRPVADRCPGGALETARADGWRAAAVPSGAFVRTL